MRTFQALFLLAFLLFYAFISLGAFQIIIKLLKTRYKQIFRIFFFLLSFSLISTFVLLYIWPGDVRTSENYKFYFAFNGLLFIDFIFKAPLSIFYIIRILFKRDYNKNTINWIGLIISSSLSFTLFYGIVSGKNNLRVNHLELQFTNLPKQFNGFNIFHISDTHLGSFINSKKILESVQIEAERIKPDLILFTGDLVNNFAYELKGWDQVFQKINKNGNGYSILGNHDYGNYSNWKSQIEKAKNFQSIIDSHKKFGFKLLLNEHQIIKLEADSIFLLGVENWGHPPFPQFANLDIATNKIPENAFEVLLTHDPAHWEQKVKSKRNIELTLSGHTHGFQLGLLLAGIPFSPSYFVRENWGGLYEFEKNFLYVNTGLGTVGIPFRIDMPAELTVITLKRIEVD